MIIKILALVLGIQVFLNASLVDNYNLFQAQIKYKNKDYQTSLSFYNQIEDKSNKIHYNIGNTLYKQKLYQKAILEYKKINSLSLNYKKLHNIANCYIALNQLQNAIIFYKSALKFKDDKNTKFNLNLAINIQKEILELEKEKQEENKNKDNQTEMLARIGKNKAEQSKNIDKTTKQKSNKAKENLKRKSDNISSLKSKQQIHKIKMYEYSDINGTKEILTSQLKLSTLEEDKWNKTLNNKTINTLLIPLTNKGMKNEKQPW